MGGSRSTRWNGHKPKRLVEQTLRFDLCYPQLRLVRAKAGFDERVLAQCPPCNRRVQILHALPEEGIFKCRGCLSLAYTSLRCWGFGDQASVQAW